MNSAEPRDLSDKLDVDPGLVSAVDEISDRIRRGLDVDLRAYEGRFPDHADYLVQLANTLRGIADLADDDAFGNGPGHLFAPDGEIGEFKVIRQIGRGGMGLVYEAHQRSLDRPRGGSKCSTPPEGSTSVSFSASETKHALPPHCTILTLCQCSPWAAIAESTSMRCSSSMDPHSLKSCTN